MRAGELRQRVQLKTKTVTRDAFGAQTIAWTVLATVWANVQAVGGSETIVQDQAAATLTHTITIRYYPAIAPTMIAVWNNRTLVVHSVTEDPKRQMMVLACSELVTT